MTQRIATQIDAVFVTEQQAAEILCQSVRTLQAWRVRGAGPPFHKFGQSVRYCFADLRDWIASCRIHNASQSGRIR